MVSLMKAITPERNQQELQEEGGTDFGFAYGARHASACRSSGSAATSPWCFVRFRTGS